MGGRAGGCATVSIPERCEAPDLQVGWEKGWRKTRGDGRTAPSRFPIGGDAERTSSKKKETETKIKNNSSDAQLPPAPDY